MNRREFLKIIFSTLTSLFGANALSIFAGEPGEILLGTIYDFSTGVHFVTEGKDALAGKVVKDLLLFAVRDENGIGIMSAKCTHRGCIVERMNDKYECPCHNALFDKNGRVLQGPAKRELVWYEARVSEGSQVFVDLSKTVAPDVRAKIV